MKLNFNKMAFMPIDIQKGIVTSGEFSPFSSDEITSKNQMLVNWFIEQKSLISLINVKPDLFKFLGPNQDLTKIKQIDTTCEFSDIILDVNSYDNVISITKYTPGAFFNTQLDTQLRVRGVDTIVLSGLITSVGVYTTAIEAYQRGYKIIVLSDACSDREAEVHEMMLEKLFSKFAMVITTDELINTKN